MHQLTDYSLKDLRIIQAAISEQISSANEYCSLVDSKVIASDQFKEDLKHKESFRLPVLREFNVHLLTAISIVKDRETVASN